MTKRGNREGSIYRRKADNKWVASITLDNRKRKVYYGKTRAEVVEKLNKALYEQQKGTFSPATSKDTVAQFLTTWLENTQELDVKPRTYERYEEIVRLHIVPVIGHHQLQKLTAQHVQALYNRKVKEGLSPTTVNTIHNVLHKALETALKWELISRNICDLTSPPSRGYHESIILDAEQIHTLLAACQGHPIEPLVILALTTAMRRGELLGLKWRDVDFDRGTLRVQRTMARIPKKFRAPGQRAFVEGSQKTKKSRRNIILLPFALDALKQHRERQEALKIKAGDAWIDNDLIFSTSIGTPVHPDRYVREPFKALLKKANLPDIRFHDLRHSSATLLLHLGIHPKIVQEILGHSNINITLNIYSHVLPTMQAEAMNKLNTVFLRQKDLLDKEKADPPGKDGTQKEGS